MRPMETEDNLSNKYPKPYRIQNFPFLLTLTHYPWNTFGCSLEVVSSVYYICQLKDQERAFKVVS
jgi:hypothetical protein